MIYKNLKKLHSDELTRLKELVPFSQLEDSIILNLNSNLSDASEEFFEKLLLENKIHFYEARTSRVLKKQWKLFKKLNLLKDQTTKQIENPTEVEGKVNLENLNLKKDLFNVNFSQVEASLDDKEIMEKIELDDELEGVIYNFL